MKYALLFLFGFNLYPLVELLWRGKTHISMGIVGGICLSLIGWICGDLLSDSPYIFRCISGAAIITAVELLAGLIINKKMGLGVWDYANLPYNFLGQICLLYSSFWLLLTIPCIWLEAWTEHIVEVFRNSFA